jgi:alpha-L-fucosidase
LDRFVSQTRAVFVVARICLSIGLVLSGSMLPAVATEVIKVPIASGPCEPTWKSLGDHFRQPKWWREAKIGMWLHWGPQSVGEDGDWYAKWIYMPKHAWGGYTRVYPHHLERIGHPSETGYKDMLLRWKAEKWDPDKLMALYKRAGARYVIAQGMHHDNVDLWNSRYQPWNSVKLGPHRDIVAGWKKAADREGIRFGIAFHGDYSLWWYQPAFLADLEGPRKGFPYDGAQNYEGKETWWKNMGLDLKDLYGIDLRDDVAFPPGFNGDPNEFRMRDPLSHGIPNGDLPKHRDFAVWYATKWTRRVIDAIDQFSPDFIYFDGGGSYPFCGHGTGRGLRADATPRVIAHLYNKSIARNGGRLEAMAFTKGNEDARAVAVNCESHVPADIKRDCTWQTENGLGEWFYLKGTFYDSGMVIHQMLEAISRDGNYAINIPLTPAGELDPGGLKTLQDMGDWMDINSEGIHGSSAWDVWGEGKVVMAGGNLNEGHARTLYTAHDIRFTTKNGAVYAWLMAWPTNGKATIRSLAEGAGKIEEVTLLGSPAKLDWQQTEDGVVVHLPPQRPCQFAFSLKVVGAGLKAVSPKTRAVKPAVDGSLTLDPEAAEVHGGVRAESRGGPMNLGYWGSGSDFVEWTVNFTASGEFQVSSQAASPSSGTILRLEADRTSLQANVPNTGSHDNYRTIEFGVLRIKTPGIQTIRIRPADPQTWKPANLRAVELRPLPAHTIDKT